MCTGPSVDGAFSL